MIAVALSGILLVAFALPSGGRRLRSRVSTQADARRSGGPGFSALVRVTLGVVGLVGGVVAGLPLLSAGVLVALTALHLARGAVARGRRRRYEAEAARSTAAVAGLLRVGLVPRQALVLATREFPVLEGVARVVEWGGSAPDALRDLGQRPGGRGFLSLARAWRMTELTGAPVAEAVDRVAEAVQRDHDLRAVVAAELAAPRATTRLLAGLPLAGLAFGFLLGGNPLTFLLSTPLGGGCLVAGVALACAGLIWTETLASRAGEPIVETGAGHRAG